MDAQESILKQTQKQKLLDRTRIVNWNELEDPVDLEVWNRANSNFWLPEKVPISNDQKSFSKLIHDSRYNLDQVSSITDLKIKSEILATLKVFIKLTLLDTIQSEIGAPSLAEDAITQHEGAVFSQFTFMECVHARSYSSIFITLFSTHLINLGFEWGESNEVLIKIATIIRDIYQEDDIFLRKIISVLLESFLFYTGFYWPFYLSSRGKLTNSADVIRLIVRDEAIHGWYCGYKYQVITKDLPQELKQHYKDKTYELLYSLYELELEFIEDVYTELGLVNEVREFLNYNANKALANLGFEPLFPEDICKVDPVILASIFPGADENHDFFSGSGSKYVIAERENLLNEDIKKEVIDPITGISYK